MSIAVPATLAVAILITPLRQILGLALPDSDSLLTAAAMCALGIAWLEGLRRAMRARSG
jgi:hypothetical protein